VEAIELEMKENPILEIGDEQPRDEAPRKHRKKTGDEELLERYSPSKNISRRGKGSTRL